MNKKHVDPIEEIKMQAKVVSKIKKPIEKSWHLKNKKTLWQKIKFFFNKIKNFIKLK
mgnify:FL=1|jgi:hypothetical protein|tara:strand:- start:65 stop:235 length:171 start_codon:yes stop_codon:yes gene_type:complete